MKKHLSLFFLLILSAQLYQVHAQRPNISVTLFKDSAFASVWSHYDSTLIAYNRPQANGYYAIYFANITPSNQRINERCFTCGNSLLPGKHVGSPDFQSTGKYIAMVVEKAVHPGSSFSSIPGMGQYDDIWVMTMDGQKAYQLTNTPSTADSASGVMFPFFSPDGKKLSWTEMTAPVNALNGKQGFGYWVIKTADFIDDVNLGPHLTNIRVLQPGGVPAFNEGYGWSPDQSKILFASDYNQFWVWDDQIYEMDTLGNNIKQMSSTAVDYPYCEHGFYSPDGKYIVWMTNEQNTVGSSTGGDDWWIMKSDTTHQERLTYFNDSLGSYWTGAIHVNGHGSFSPDGKRFVGDVGGNKPLQLDSTQIGDIYVVNMENFLTATEDVNLNMLRYSVFPNPASNYLHIELNIQNIKLNYSLSNLLGQTLTEGTLRGNSLTLDVSKYPSGVYMLRLSDGKTELNKKVLVNRD